jgi:hypothetical protein
MAVSARRQQLGRVPMVGKQADADVADTSMGSFSTMKGRSRVLLDLAAT